MAVKFKEKKTADTKPNTDLVAIRNELSKLNQEMGNMVYEKVFPLADALQLPIEVFTDGTGNFELKGSRKWVLPIVKNDFNFQTKIEASTVSNYESAVLVHISKDFWVYAHFSNEVELAGVITLYYLDFKGNPSKPIKAAVDGQDLETALLTLRPLIRAKFIKGTEEILWKELPIKVAIKVPKE